MDQTPLNRRLYARFPVKLKAGIVSKPSGSEMDGEVLDISLGGVLVRVPAELQGEIRITFTLDGVPCVFDAYVVRRDKAERRAYGVEFHPNPEMEKTLKSLLPPRSTGL